MLTRMPRAGRRRLASGRASNQAARIGADVKLSRATLALSVDELARRAGVASSTVERVESGEPGVQLNTIVSIAAAVGLDVVLTAYPGKSPSLRDTGQLTIANALRIQAEQHWRAQLEVPAGDHGRAADLVLYGTDEIQHFEIERAATDFQAQLRAAVVKRAEIARRHARPVRLILAVEDSRRNRALAERHAEIIASQLPASSREVLRSLRSGMPLGRDGFLWVRRSRVIAPSPAFAR